MQHQSPSRNLTVPSLSSSWRPTLRGPSIPENQDRWASAHAAQEEAWTQYDGLGPVHQSRDISKDWRSREQAVSAPKRGGRGLGPNDLFDSKGKGGRGSASRGGGQRERSRERQPSPPLKRNRGLQDIMGRNTHKTETVDDLFLTRNYEQFNPADYKDAPTSLFTNPKIFLWDYKGITAKSSFASHKGGIYRCTVIATLPDRRRIEACGDSAHKKVAEKSACRHLVLKLHQRGLLRDIVSGGESEGAHDRELLSDEADAMMDIYDYCARFDATPRFTVEETRRTGTKKALFNVTVEMPEQSIQASARAADRRSAEILACVEFKRQAEEFHSKHGGSTIMVKDLMAINSRNARKFFEFYKISDKAAHYEAELTPIGGKRGSGGYKGQLLLNQKPIGEPVEFHSKKSADTAAYLSGAIGLKKLRPDLFPRFLEALRIGNGELLKPLVPSWVAIDRDCVDAMAETLKKVKRIGLPPTQAEEDRLEREEEERNSRRSGPRRGLDKAFIGVKSKKLLEAYEEYLRDPRLEILRNKREELPMNQYRAKVLDIINNHVVSIIVGATGSGKTTQVPQILLEEAIKKGTGAECNIICTQPRRIAATSVAQRVAVERNEPLQKSIGYQVRFDSKLPIAGGSITYCTTGILLQQLRNSADDALDGITHLVIDEVHERDILIDFLLIILKRVMQDRITRGKPEVKVVLMSATMDTELFAKYFKYHDKDGNHIPCPNLSVPGRTFPVKEVYLEDIQEILHSSYRGQELALLRDEDTRAYLDLEQNISRDASRVPSRVPSRAASGKGEVEDDVVDATINWKQEIKLTSDGQVVISNEKEDAIVPVGLIALTVAHIARTSRDGAILVFLPGLEEIQAVDEVLRTQPLLGINFADELKFKLSMLHSSIPNQNEVFEEVPEGCRKVILSTNIAETSVTIPDVKYVVDSGKLREKQYEQARRITQLVCTWISKSNSRQRAGRAGRVQNGNYFALFTRSRFESLRPTGLPEMLRSDLQEICLDIKAQGFKDPVSQFLSEAIEPPPPAVIEASLTQLRVLAALTDDEALTPLGRVLATMPVEPALGKMILLGVIFRCLDPIVILGSSSGVRDIFVSPPERRAEANQAKHSFVRGTGSDHMGLVNAFREWRTTRDRDGMHAAHRFAEENFLHRGALRTLDATTNQIEELLVQAGVIPFTRRSERHQSAIGHPYLNEYSGCVPLVKALTLAGMYPNVAIATGGKGLRTANENFSMIHPTSVHYTSRSDNMSFGSLVTYTTKAKSNDGGTLLLRTVTEAMPLMAMLFGGKLMIHNGSIVEIDSWLPFQVPSFAARATAEFRQCLDRLLAHAFRGLSKRGSNNSNFLADGSTREAFARGMVEVLENDSQRKDRKGQPADRSSAYSIRKIQIGDLKPAASWDSAGEQPTDISRGFGNQGVASREQPFDRGNGFGGLGADRREQPFGRGNGFGGLGADRREQSLDRGNGFGQQGAGRREQSFDRGNGFGGLGADRREQPFGRGNGFGGLGADRGEQSLDRGNGFGQQGAGRREQSFDRGNGFGGLGADRREQPFDRGNGFGGGPGADRREQSLDRGNGFGQQGAGRKEQSFDRGNGFAGLGADRREQPFDRGNGFGGSLGADRREQSFDRFNGFGQGVDRREQSFDRGNEVGTSDMARRDQSFDRGSGPGAKGGMRRDLPSGRGNGFPGTGRRDQPSDRDSGPPGGYGAVRREQSFDRGSVGRFNTSGGFRRDMPSDKNREWRGSQPGNRRF